MNGKDTCHAKADTRITQRINPKLCRQVGDFLSTVKPKINHPLTKTSIGSIDNIPSDGQIDHKSMLQNV